MEKIQLGNSELFVSFIGLGTMNFGAVNTEDESHKILDYYFNRNGNFIDTANVYSKGDPHGNFHEKGFAEQIIGSWLNKTKKRNQIILATKVKGDMGDGHPGLTKTSIKYQIEQSLKRLQTDYIDLYQVHGFDETIPHGEIFETMIQLKEQGKIRYYGCCNYSQSQIESTSEIAIINKYPYFVCCQNGYNLIFKERFKKLEDNYIFTSEFLNNKKISYIHYNSLANGFLAGKYDRNTTENLSSRGSDDVIRKNCFNENGWNLLQYLKELSIKYSTSAGSIVLDWYKQTENITVSLVGPRTLEQIKSLISNTDFSISDEEYRKIDDLSIF